jgi:drug/metabolite transporter (DMT)-like permease
MKISFRGYNKDSFLSIFFIILSVLFWGISFIRTKVVLREMPPVSIAFFRQLIALVPLAVCGAATKSSFRMKPKDLLLLAGSCFFGIVLYFVFENNGLRYTTASSASMIVSSVPVFTMISESIFFKLKVSFRMVLCIAVSITGVFLLVSVNGKLDFSSASFRGNLLMACAMISWVIYTIMSRGLGRRYSSLVITTCQTAISSFLFIPFMLPEIGSWKGISLLALANLIYLGIFCSAVAYFTFIYAMNRLGSTVSAAFLNLVPVVSVIAGFFILGERLMSIQYIGMMLILASLFYLNKKQKSQV